MEDLRQEMKDLNKKAIKEKEEKARIEGRIEMLTESLNELGLDLEKATKEVNLLSASILKCKKTLSNRILAIKKRHAKRFQKRDK